MMVTGTAGLFGSRVGLVRSFGLTQSCSRASVQTDPSIQEAFRPCVYKHACTECIISMEYKTQLCVGGGIQHP